MSFNLFLLIWKRLSSVAIKKEEAIVNLEKDFNSRTQGIHSVKEYLITVKERSYRVRVEELKE
ncbi:hypothetical protein Amet_4700 [Alkaliphilus metalliredigens QYMF]|uniref:Uncharacterized protein n=1 Tax=Alkaliphilus metalliredigens (strain QYMF) TaxID=293826 RepID=A6TX50_ALKMQ|nr:hypothetical protein [Alkaliphilus metalliredigens]ABR50768.1 hypothetical protein Amet_4700 [Alkaliphilus metalliredigens QYMF]